MDSLHGVFFLSVLFAARFPYYRVFLNTFDSNMLGVLYENFPGLWAMCLEYNVGAGLIAAFLLTFLWVGLAKKWVFKKFFHLKGGGQRFGFLAVVVAFIFFARLGGSFTASSSAIDWANYSRLKDHLLNEAILDDMQAMLRVFRLYKDSGPLYGIHESNIAQSCFSMNGSVHSHLLSAYLQKEAPEALIEKPKHIFIIFGESQAQWPLLKQYRVLGIAEGLHSLIERKDAVSVDRFLPVGTNTSLSVQGILTGLPCVYKNNHKIPTGGRAYLTAMAPSLKRLGYQTEFWFGGYGSWGNFAQIARQQGFDAFYSSPDFDTQPGNIYGSEDKTLFSAVFASLAEKKPTVHMIMTLSNHPPYTVNLQAEGFDDTSIRENLPDYLKKDEAMIKTLGHYWYADKTISNFVRDTLKQYPDSLFVVTGDHANRTNIVMDPSVTERSAVPFILLHKGIDKSMFPTNAVGGHLDIVPTIIELIAPQGFIYYSVGKSLREGHEIAFNNLAWVTRESMGSIGMDRVEVQQGEPGGKAERDREKAESYISSVRTIAWWMQERGDTFQ